VVATIVQLVLGTFGLLAAVYAASRARAAEHRAAAAERAILGSLGHVHGSLDVLAKIRASNREPIDLEPIEYLPPTPGNDTTDES
jgi:hypothetical protein